MFNKESDEIVEEDFINDEYLDEELIINSG